MQHRPWRRNEGWAWAATREEQTWVHSGEEISADMNFYPQKLKSLITMNWFKIWISACKHRGGDPSPRSDQQTWGAAIKKIQLYHWQQPMLTIKLSTHTVSSTPTYTPSPPEKFPRVVFSVVALHSGDAQESLHLCAKRSGQRLRSFPARSGSVWTSISTAGSLLSTSSLVAS